LTEKRYSVEEVSALFNITPRTLHYYEEIGLIPDVARTEGGHRFYNQQTVDLIAHIIRIKNLMGISLQDISRVLDAERNLEQIKELLQSEDSNEQKFMLLEQAANVLQQMAETIEDKINNLQILREGFLHRLEKVNQKRSNQNN
jgi:DNA-binding transcriptional MerR regulator